jgi:hypothetical protein
VGIARGHRRRGAAAAAARRRCWRPNSRGGAAAREGRRARGCARASGYYCRRAELGSRRGVVAAFTAEPGSTPWVAASGGPVVGWRERDGGARRCVQGDRERGVPSSWRPCARPTWPRRGHGGTAVLGTAASDGVGTKMGQRPVLASRVEAHACWGARLGEGVAARTDARANSHAS